MEFNTFHQYSRYCDAMPSSHTNSTLMFSYHAPAYSPLHPRWAEKWSVLLCEPLNCPRPAAAAPQGPLSAQPRAQGGCGAAALLEGPEEEYDRQYWPNMSHVHGCGSPSEDESSVLPATRGIGVRSASEEARHSLSAQQKSHLPI